MKSFRVETCGKEGFALRRQQREETRGVLVAEGRRCARMLGWALLILLLSPFSNLRSWDLRMPHVKAKRGPEPALDSTGSSALYSPPGCVGSWICPGDRGLL